ncbi:hypothetical protein SCLCIDRAFT_1206763 [Scleroderma citrinum Foug A]|uniref:Peptidase C14 caspase domain-containing protein n=1 Tax=Scleroderma citrinum Foug A TaxID=1036808 RepID=A0A0C3AA72_9AGAM|nr:hypothetical protein SCLCIDRAFT_1206763 [Scleroderma citrinum Foug A]
MTRSMCAKRAPPSPVCNVVTQDNLVATNGTRRKRALLIAAGEVPGYPCLVQAKDDTWALRKLLMEREYLDDDIVVMMKDEKVDECLWPRRDNIRAQIQKFVGEASSGDHLFVYFSGHGTQIPCSHHTESDGYDECILSCSGRFIPDNCLHKYLVKALRKDCRLFALWDACHSRTMLDLAHYKCNEPPRKRRRSSSNCLPSRAFAKCPKIADRTNYRSFCPSSRRRSSRRNSLPLPRDLQDRPPSVVLDAQRFLSPEPIFKCDGQCPLPADNLREGVAHIVSLSACRDNELAYDDAEKNESLTKFFIAYLRDKPNPTLGQLLEHLRMKVNEMLQRNRKRTAPLSPTRNASDGFAKSRRPQAFRKEGVMVDEVMDMPHARRLKRTAPCHEHSQIPGVGHLL